MRNILLLIMITIVGTIQDKELLLLKVKKTILHCPVLHLDNIIVLITQI